jgi:hypothetical protein
VSSLLIAPPERLPFWLAGTDQNRSEQIAQRLGACRSVDIENLVRLI